MLATRYRLPPRLMTWPGSLGILLLLLAPLVAVLGLSHGPVLAVTLGWARDIALCAAVLVSAALVHAHGRVAGNEQSEWLAAALGVPAVLALARSGHSLTRPEDAAVHTGDVLVLMGLGLVTSLLLLGCALRPPGRVRPLLVAVPPLAVLLVGQQVLLTSSPWPALPPTPALAAGHVVLALALAALVHRLVTLPEWARARMGAAIVLAVAAGGLGAVAGDRWPLSALCLAAGLLAAVTTATTSLALLRSVLGDEHAQLSVLQERLAAAEAARRADRARLHEVTSMVAGIASATRLVHEVPPPEAQLLETLVLDELGRLQRLLGRRGRGPGEPLAAARDQVDLDEVIGRVAAAHAAQGHRVRAPTGGLSVPSDADTIAEILDILVDNAAQHGSADDITIEVQRHPVAVEIHVSDRGPGVAPELRETLFDWEQRGPGSPGQGIGLHTADLLARRLGGRLRLAPSRAGARFVLRLPARAERTGARVGLSHAR